MISTHALAFRVPSAACPDEASARLAPSSVKLLANSTSVLKYSTDGSARWLQSVVPSRTNSALLNAAKLMVMANTPTQMPLLDARSCPLYASAWAEARLGGWSALAWEFTVVTIVDIFSYPAL